MTSFVRILKTLIRLYDVTLIYAADICQMQNTNGLCCLCQNSKYKWLLQGKGSQIQISNKTIIEFGSRRI